MPANASDWIGLTVANGRYRVDRILGEGGMGSVFLGSDSNLNDQVVIKIPQLFLLGNREFTERFALEVRSLVKLTHPHIVKIRDVGTHDGIPFAVMQYLAGGSLWERRLNGTGQPVPMNADKIAAWLGDVASALDFVHKQNYLHRDIKPGNILFDEHDNVYLGDFGVAKALAAAQEQRGEALTGGGIVGTAEYIAPEAVMGKTLTGAADQYSLAVTVYELLAGSRPFSGPNPTSIAVKHTMEAPPPLSRIRPDLPQSVCDAVHRGLDKDPAGRFASCSAFADAFVKAATSKVSASCPACNKKLSLKPSAVGKQVKCPSCSNSIVPKIADSMGPDSRRQTIAMGAVSAETISGRKQSTATMTDNPEANEPNQTRPYTQPGSTVNRMAQSGPPSARVDLSPQGNSDAKSLKPLLIIGGCVTAVSLVVLVGAAVMFLQQKGTTAVPVGEPVVAAAANPPQLPEVVPETPTPEPKPVNTPEVTPTTAPEVTPAAGGPLTQHPAQPGETPTANPGNIEVVNQPSDAPDKGPFAEDGTSPSVAASVPSLNTPDPGLTPLPAEPPASPLAGIGMAEAKLLFDRTRSEIDKRDEEQEELAAIKEIRDSLFGDLGEEDPRKKAELPLLELADPENEPRAIYRLMEDKRPEDIPDINRVRQAVNAYQKRGVGATVGISTSRSRTVIDTSARDSHVRAWEQEREVFFAELVSDLRKELEERFAETEHKEKLLNEFDNIWSREEPQTVRWKARRYQTKFRKFVSEWGQLCRDHAPEHIEKVRKREAEEAAKWEAKKKELAQLQIILAEGR